MIIICFEFPIFRHFCRCHNHGWTNLMIGMTWSATYLKEVSISRGWGIRSCIHYSPGIQWLYLPCDIRRMSGNFIIFTLSHAIDNIFEKYLATISKFNRMWKLTEVVPGKCRVTGTGVEPDTSESAKRCWWCSEQILCGWCKWWVCFLVFFFSWIDSRLILVDSSLRIARSLCRCHISKSRFIIFSY